MGNALRRFSRADVAGSYRPSSREEREEREAAHDRERRFRAARDDMRQLACALLLKAPVTRTDIHRAQRLAKAAERFEEWRLQAWRRSVG